MWYEIEPDNIPAPSNDESTQPRRLCRAVPILLSPRIRLRPELAQFDEGRGLPAVLAVFGDHIGENAAAHVELGGEAHEARLGRGDQVVEDAVGDVLVEVAFLAERPHVELQALQFDALLVGDVVEDQRREIRLAGFGAQAGEFRDLHMDMVVALRVRVREGFQRFQGVCAHVGLPVGFG